MIPENEVYLDEETSTENEEVLPSKTYKIDFENKRMVELIDEKEAVMQFIRKALNTDKYAFEIYDWYYGNELLKLVGQPYDYVVTRIPNIFNEALLVDDRILEVRDFEFSESSIDSILVSCYVDTVYGTIYYDMEVSI